MCHPLHTEAMKDLMGRLVDEAACPGGFLKLILASLHAYTRSIENMVAGTAPPEVEKEDVERKVFNVMFMNMIDAFAYSVHDEKTPRQDLFLLLLAAAFAATLEFEEEHDGNPDALHPAGDPQTPGELLRLLADQVDEEFNLEAFAEHRAQYERENAEAELGEDIVKLGGAGNAIETLLREMGFGGPDEQVH